jgi:hypothetical protein
MKAAMLAREWELDTSPHASSKWKANWPICLRTDGLGESVTGLYAIKFIASQRGIMTEANLNADSRTVTPSIPIAIGRRGGRKLVLAPDGTTDTWVAPCRRTDNARIKAGAFASRLSAATLSGGSRHGVFDRKLCREICRLSCVSAANG